MILKGRDSDEAICLVSKQVEEVGKQLQFSVFLLIRISFFSMREKNFTFLRGLSNLWLRVLTVADYVRGKICTCLFVDFIAHIFRDQFFFKTLQKSIYI